jgi:thiol-disulfide isomerase/thioredoxin
MDANQQPAHAPSSLTRKWSLAIVIAAAVGLYLLAAMSMRDHGDALAGPAVGRRLPYFRLEPLTGQSTAVTLDDLPGHVTLVNYWGTWCPPCRLEFPHIVDLAARFANHPEFRIYAVSCGQGGDEDLASLRSTTEEFLEIAKVDLPTYADQNQASRQALSLVLEDHQFGYPTTLLLDRAGAIRGVWRGYQRGAELEMLRGIEALLNAAEQPQGSEKAAVGGL